ncbi:MAG: hypothetical protein ABL883_08700 [Terricaulis sp.]
MRALISLVSACFVLVTHTAAAQQNVSPPTQGTLSQDHISAARETLSALLLDSGFLSAISLEAFHRGTPFLRSRISDWPFYGSLSPEKRRALAAYVDGFPPMGQAEAIRGASELIDRFAPQVAALFSESELHDISAYVHTPEARGFMLRAGLDGVHGEPSGSNEASETEVAAWIRFSQTPGGAAMIERLPQFGAMMSDIGAASTGSPRVSARMQHDFCAILAEQCPAPWRTH